MTLESLITQLEAAAREATEGVWKRNYDNRIGFHNPDTSYTPIGHAGIYEDAEYITLANPATILRLTQALREAVKVVEWYGAPDPGIRLRFNHGGRDFEMCSERARDFLARWKGEGT